MAAKLLIKPKRTPQGLFSKSLVHLTYVQEIQKDLESLETRHKTNEKIYYLNQSYFIHLVAGWEIFIEDLAQYGFEKLTKSSHFGAGASVINRLVQSDISALHSASPGNIDRLFLRIIGINEITKTWLWKDMTNKQAIGWLKTILAIRHEIAHTGHVRTENLSYKKNYEYMKHLFNLAYLTEYEVEKYVAEKLGEEFTEIKQNVPYPENFVKQ